MRYTLFIFRLFTKVNFTIVLTYCSVNCYGDSRRNKSRMSSGGTGIKLLTQYLMRWTIILFQLLIIPTIVCVGLGQYLCTKDGADDDTKCTTAWPITDWSNKPAGSQLNGQYYVFAAAIFIFLVLLLNFCGGLFPIKLNRKAVK